jgi:DNA polymerase III gamma/tau subunit
MKHYRTIYCDLRFNKLPETNIIVFLDKICKSENINISILLI